MTEAARQINAGGGIKSSRNSKLCLLSALSLVPFENSICIDKRCHLEVVDRAHRYAKNLRAYYAMWCKIFESALQGDLTSDISSVGADIAAHSPVNIHNSDEYHDEESVSRLGIDRDTMDCYKRFFKWLDSPGVHEVSITTPYTKTLCLPSYAANFIYFTCGVE